MIIINVILFFEMFSSNPLYILANIILRCFQLFSLKNIHKKNLLFLVPKQHVGCFDLILVKKVFLKLSINLKTH